MKYKINEEEKSIILQFKGLRIPTIFKTDNTDFILFVEDVDFIVCDTLLNGSEITEELYDSMVHHSKDNLSYPCYNEFMKFVEKFRIDEYSKFYCDCLIEVMEIFKKYYQKYFV